MIIDKALEFHNGTSVGAEATENGTAVDLLVDPRNAGTVTSLVTVISFQDAGAGSGAVTFNLQDAKADVNGDATDWATIASVATIGTGVKKGGRLYIKVPPNTRRFLRLQAVTAAATTIGAKGFSAQIVLDYPKQHAYPAGSEV